MSIRTADFTRPAVGGCDHLDDGSLVDRFEALHVPASDFRHREHVRLAFAMLAGSDFGDAALRFRCALRRFASAIGAPTRYHETLTWAYLTLINERVHSGAYSTSQDFVTRNPDLLDHATGAVSRHYDVTEITASPLARRLFVLPVR